MIARSPSRTRLLLLLPLATLLVIYLTCAWELFSTPARRALTQLKNRTAIPAARDIDPNVTLDAMLARGDDRTRWSSSRAAAIEGIVAGIFEAKPEAANCYSLTRRDTHIELALGANAPLGERVTAEVTPLMRDHAAARGLDWSTDVLKRDFLGRRVRIIGWLLFDIAHDEQSENTRPDHDGNWRATAWEIHPITSIVVLD